MSKITEDQREALDGVLTNLDVLHELLEAVPMLHVQWNAITQSREAIEGHAMDAIGIQRWERCEECEELIVAGDLVHETEEGCYLCEACAPTTGEVLRQYEEILGQPDDGAASGIDIGDLRERTNLLKAYSPEDLARKALAELT